PAELQRILEIDCPRLLLRFGWVITACPAVILGVAYALPEDLPRPSFFRKLVSFRSRAPACSGVAILHAARNETSSNSWKLRVITGASFSALRSPPSCRHAVADG